MISQMNAVHEGARLAMGDRRAADPLRRHRRQPLANLQRRLLSAVAAILLIGVLAALLVA